MDRAHRGVPDSELWQRAAEHDGAAFGDLFERHSDAVYLHCFRRTASWSSAEELTSVVFLEEWRLRRTVRLHGDSILPFFVHASVKGLTSLDRSSSPRVAVVKSAHILAPYHSSSSSSDKRILVIFMALS
ncbi:MAG: hypothetical protein WAL04_09295 [Acidimicrobiales bacterium]